MLSLLMLIKWECFERGGYFAHKLAYKTLETLDCKCFNLLWTRKSKRNYSKFTRLRIRTVSTINKGKTKAVKVAVKFTKLFIKDIWGMLITPLNKEIRHIKQR